MPACPYIRRFVHPSARSFAGRPVCAAEALRRLCVATHRLRTAAGVCIVRRIASRPLHPPHCLPSAVSAAPRCIDAPFIPAPRPPHCVSSAASAALPPVRRVRRAPSHRRSVHSRAPSAALCLFRCIRRIASRPPCPPRPVASTLRSFPRPVRRIVSLPLHPPHCLPSAVSAAPRRIDAPFIPAPRPPHCVSSAASAALPPVRRVRRAPSHRRSVHSRAPSAALCLFRCIRRIASRPPCPPRPVCPRRIRHACAELRDPAHPRVRSVSSACSPRLRLSGSSAAAAPCPSHVLAPMPPPDGRRGPPGIKNKY